MGQKVKPNSLRLGLTVPWSSRWFYKKSLRFYLEEDHLIREFLKERILKAGIDTIDIERIGQEIKVIIRTARPGLIIGRGGKGVEDLKNELQKKIIALRKANKKPLDFNLKIEIEELKKGEVSAKIIAQQMAFEIQKRIPYRTVMKRALNLIMQHRGVQGAKVEVSGRLNGAEIARSDWLKAGRLPLQTLRANIDYGEATAFNTYGTVGIKVYIYKGDIFEEKEKSES